MSLDRRALLEGLTGVAALAAFRGELQSQNSNHESAAAISQQRVRAKRAISRTRLKGAKTQVKRRRRAK